jgi:hypothetical protein
MVVSDFETNECVKKMNIEELKDQKNLNMNCGIGVINVFLFIFIFRIE